MHRRQAWAIARQRLFAARLLRQVLEIAAQARRSRRALRKSEARRQRAIGEVEAVGIDAGATPDAARRAAQFHGVEIEGVTMIVVHVRDGAFFGVDEIPSIRDDGEHVLGFEVGGAGKAAIEMRRDDLHAPKREIGETGIELRLGMVREETPAQPRLVGRLPRHRRKASQHRQPRMRQSVALAGFGQQHRGAAVGLEVGGVGGKPRGQDDRGTVGIGADIAQRGEGVPGIAVQSRQRSAADAAQQFLSHGFGVEIGRLRRGFRQAIRHGTRKRAGSFAHGVVPLRPRIRAHFQPFSLVSGPESHSCCKEATIRTPFTGFNARGTTPSEGAFMPTIALVDDDRNILTSVSMALEAEGYRIMTYTDGASAIDGFKTSPPDLAILDIKMPRMDGMETLRRLRQKSDVPVIFLTSKDEEIDELFGLKMGAADFIRRPISQRLHVERVKSVQRRALPNDPTATQKELDAKALERGLLRIDPERHTCSWKNEPVTLTVTEFLILQALAQRPGVEKSRSALMAAAYDDQVYVDDRTIDSHIKRLRKKFKVVDDDFEMIETLYGVGYRFKEAA